MIFKNSLAFGVFWCDIALTGVKAQLLQLLQMFISSCIPLGCWMLCLSDIVCFIPFAWAAFSCLCRSCLSHQSLGKFVLGGIARSQFWGRFVFPFILTYFYAFLGFHNRNGFISGGV